MVLTMTTKKNTPLILSCQRVHELVSQGMDRELSLSDRSKVRLHLLICSSCTNFKQQMGVLRQAMQRLPSMTDKDD